MVSPGITSGVGALIDFEFPGSDLAAVVPYVLPLIFVGTVFLLYQRYMPRAERNRNLLVLGGVVCYLLSFVLVLYAGFGAIWWGADEHTIGSWSEFVGVLQFVTDSVFGTVLIGVAYIVIISVLFALIANRVIAPPDPDFTGLKQELAAAKDEAKGAKPEIQKLESENKKLNEFISEKEANLATFHGEIESLKALVAEREAAHMELELQLKAAASPADIPADKEDELLVTISRKDQQIGVLQSELANLQLIMESAEKGATVGGGEKVTQLEAALKGRESIIEDYNRRAQTATEVADSVMSDLAQLISQVEGSAIDASAKVALTNLIENLGKSMGRVTGPPSERDKPKIELIGAVMMAHEIVDSIKKMTRA
ncbi:MAG: hypothetical protein KAJ96_04510 [Candidatus Thorarchaeota archaeon]|nr:hypothetical protein [Candidatus Thorarchaeota archaeon]